MDGSASRSVLRASTSSGITRVAQWYERNVLGDLLRIPADAVRFEQRGFEHVGVAQVAHLEAIGATFLEGFHAGARHDVAYNATRVAPVDLDILSLHCDARGPELRGFAYEGCAMALALRDALCPGRKLWQAFTRGVGARHVHLCHVGRGWALARLPWCNVEARLDADAHANRYGPFVWLAQDGHGFHQAYFRTFDVVRRQRRPRFRSPVALSGFDQGVGRALWFVEGARVDRIAAVIAGFEPSRRADLWSGAGLAAGYAGTAPRMPRTPGRAAEIPPSAMLDRAGPDARWVAQGMAFAAKARQLGDDLTPSAVARIEGALGIRIGELVDCCDRAFDASGVNDYPARFPLWRCMLADALARRLRLDPSGWAL